jgi:hypothetical protein
LQVADSPAGYGLGHHGMGGAAWGGHYDCPGPNNVALKPAIVARAIEIVNGVGGDDMSREDAINAAQLLQLGSDRYGYADKGEGAIDPAQANNVKHFAIVEVEKRLTAAIKAISTGGIDVNALADQIAAKLAANTAFTAAVADAVNDDAAKRLQA